MAKPSVMFTVQHTGQGFKFLSDYTYNYTMRGELKFNNQRHQWRWNEDFNTLQWRAYRELAWLDLDPEFAVAYKAALARMVVDE